MQAFKIEKMYSDDNEEDTFDSELEESGSDDYTDSSCSDDDELAEIEPIYDYTEEVTNILSEFQSVNNENALAINRMMQNKLFKFREMLEELLLKCEHKFISNREILKSTNLKKGRKSNVRMCGAPFFKDMNKFAAPVNDDYRTRFEGRHELFPMDLKLAPQRYWTVNDKCKLVQVIKCQALEYLQPEKKTKANNTFRSTQKSIELNTKRLTTLLEKVGNNFKINWDLVSKDGLMGRHSDKSCYAMWYGYMRPELNRGKWTTEENNSLMLAAEKHNFQNWPLISREMSGRSENQCFVQFQNIVNTHLPNNRKWSPYEDQQLLKAVQTHTLSGAINWNKVRGYFINRSKKSIYTRYKNVLNPHIKKGHFSREEDCILLAAVEEYGENFACIPMSLFPNRSRQQVKSRYYSSIRYQGKKRGWTVDDDEKLIEYVKTNGKGKWAGIAEILKVHSRGSCRTRFSVIERFLRKNPNATPKDFPRKNKGIVTDIRQDNWVEKIYELKTKGDIRAEELAMRKEKFQQRRDNRGDNYRDVLRAVDRQFYEILKYTYDYQFEKLDGFKAFLPRSLPTLFVTLNCDASMNDLRLKRKLFAPSELNLLKSCMSKQTRKGVPNFGNVPINWSTLLGIRALTILESSDAYKNALQCGPLKSAICSEAEKKFKERFMKIFYKTALLMKLNPDVTNKRNFIVQYFVSDNNKVDDTENIIELTNDESEEEMDFPSTSSSCPKRRKL